MRWVVILLQLYVTLIPMVKGDVQITYTLKNYANKDNLDIRLRKCESFSFLGDHCDPTFQFTAYTTNSRGERIVTLKREVGPFRNTRFIEMVMETSQIQQVFPDMIDFELDVHDSDADNDQRIALFARKIPITKVGEIEMRLGVDVRVDILIQIKCAEEYYGHRCETYCKPYSGLWTCHEVTGARVCAKPCVHGSCVLTSTSAVCVCASGWSGEFCKMPVDSSLISSLIIPEMPPESADLSTPEAAVDQTADIEILPNVYLPAALASSSSPPNTTATTTNRTETNNTIATITTTLPTENIHEMLDANGESQNQSVPSTIYIVPPSTTEATAVVTDAVWSSQPWAGATTSETTAGIFSTQQTDDLEIASGNANETVIKHAVGHSSGNSSIYLIVLTIISVAIIWALLILAIIFFIHRRRKTGKNSNHSGSVWTNTSYDLSPNSTHCSSPHKYQNTLSSYASSQTGSIRTLSSGSHGLNGIRRGLPKVPSDEHSTAESVRYTAPPVITGSRIRFAAPKVDPLPPKATELPCMTDPYDELTYLGDDYAIWEQEAPAAAPLTSFQ